NPSNSQDFYRLWEDLGTRRITPHRIIHGWALHRRKDPSFHPAEFSDICATYLFSVLHLVKAARQHDRLSIREIVVLTNDLYNITGYEDAAPAKSISLGLLKVISQEYPVISTLHIDLSLQGRAVQPTTEALLAEIFRKGTGRTVALRGARRWLQEYVAVPFFARNVVEKPLFRHRGVYLITGGLGSLGFVWSRFLQRKYQATIILVGRSSLEEIDATPEVQSKLRMLRLLQQEEGAVSYYSCDVSDLSGMRQLVCEVEERFGRIDGVVHAAGMVKGRSIAPIATLEEGDFSAQFLPKITGLMVLQEALAGREIGCRLVISSLSPILGGLEFGAYASANSYMDHLVQAMSADPKTRWTCLNIDGLNLKGGQGEGIRADELETVLEMLPAYMGLSQIVVSVADLNRRLDQWIRREADPVEEPDISGAVEGAAPEGSVTDRLIQLWKKFFGVTHIGPEDDFLELGGDSLKALTMVGRIYREFNVELPVKDLFNHSTIRNLSARIADQGKPADTKTYHSIPIAAAMESYSLSSVQRRLYFLYEFDKSSTAYNQALTLKLNGRVDGDKIGEVFRQLIRRHESLRTSFGMVGEEPRQQVAEDWLFNVEVLKADGDEDKLIRDFIRPFNLGKAPLIRAGLIEVAAEQYILVVDMHHIITDAVSKGVLMKDFMALYAGEQLPAPRLQYKDFVQWQREDRQQEEMKRKKAFWFREFSEVLPPMELPADHPRPSVKTYDGDAYSFELDASLTTSLTALAEKEGSTLFMVLLTAYTVLLSRLAMQDDIVVGTYTAGRQHPDLESILGMFVNTLPLRFRVSRHLAFRELLAQVKTRVLQCFDNQSYPYEELIDDLKWERDASRNPLFEALFSYRNYEHTALELPGLRIGEYPRVKVVVNFDLTLTAIRQRDILSLEFEYATRLFNRDTIGRFAGFFKKIILALVDTPETAIGAIDILSGAQRQQLLFGFNQTQGVYPDTETIVSLFERQASKTPDAVAIVYEGKQLTFRELDETSRRLAVFLRERYGIAPGKTVAIMVQRSEWLLVGLLGILMAGGAYLPIDAGYPESRIAYILEDSGARVLLTDRGSGKPPAGQYENIDVEDAAIYAAHPLPLKRTHTPQDLCYLIYTSGSTGKPKGVMITHKNVVNFFSAMNERLGDTVSGCMLAVTSASFDISVLELLWTLCRGMQVVLHPSDISLTTLDRYVVEEKGTVDFSLFFFSSYHFDEQDKYRLLLESVRYADRHGFKAVWTPERHFHEFGGLYPNPSVVSAALAMVTSKIELRSGSIVAPLHDPLRIAEEWAVADNLSNGRIGLSFASGWNPADFVLATTDYKDRQDTLYSQLDEVKKLWKGETVLRRNGLDREVEVRVFPAPVQRELPVWITSGGSEESFIRAGAAGANLLTHLLGQDITELARKISLYRQALRENGHHENKAIVTLMLHAYIGESTAEVEQAVQAPFTEYLKSSIGLSRVFNEESGLKEEDIPEQEKERMIQNAFRRYYKTGSLIGTQTSCREMISRVRAAGVDEIACLIDFGVDPQKVLEGLERLREVKDLVNSASRRHAPVTMLQSTPSFIRLSLESPGSQQLLSSLQYLLLGGEPVPLSLVQRLRKEAPDTRIFNMYGPTETTIWSCAGELMKDADKITIGTPILNTQIYILDNDLQLLPIGVAGEVYIGGEGLSQGYWERPELTAERFIANPFVKGGCIYRTGDIGRWLPDGTIELQGRRDQQVKVRGYRIELGEIEQVLCAYAHVKEAVVAARDGKDGEKYLAAYVVAEGLQDLSGLREYVSLHLPQYMVPGHFVRLENLPLTPNGKIDRKALPDPEIGPAYADVAPSNETEKKLAALWSEILKLDEKVIGVRSSFFEMGGHSLNALVLIRRIARDFQVEILLQKIFVLQTIERIADVIDNTRWVLGQTREEVTRGEEVILE
ncbi:MAG TPA: MupA/Atu3671 family FMN-dependent luciferase-like monooxygenase, partial [Puia sp.]|nr:MupA/Atu3671 family FMN-dependent luciferase-like monooxygenase [Puia sp.]